MMPFSAAAPTRPRLHSLRERLSIGEQFVTIRAEGNTDIPTTTVRTNAYVDDSSLPGYGLSFIELDGEEVPVSRFRSPTWASPSTSTEEPVAFSSTVTLSATPWTIWRSDPGVRLVTFLMLPASSPTSPAAA